MTKYLSLTGLQTLVDNIDNKYASKTSVPSAYQPKITAGTGLAFSGNTLNITLDTTLYQVVEELPESGQNPNKIYLILGQAGDQNTYTEYLWVSNKWEKLGEYKAAIDLTPYLTKTEAASTYAPKTHTHTAAQVTGLTASRALVSDSSGHPAVSTVTSTELGYLDGVTSAIQTQLNNKAPLEHTHDISDIEGKVPTSQLPVATATTVGVVKGGSSSGKTYGVAIGADGAMTVTVPWTDNNTTYDVFDGATSSAAGSTGLVPAPTAGKQASFLKGDGTWAVPTNTTYTAGDGLTLTGTEFNHKAYTAKTSGLYKVTVDALGHVSATAAVAKTDITALGIPAQDTTYTNATTSKDGLMSSEDKTKLDGIAAGANKYVLPAATADILGGIKVGSGLSISAGVLSVDSSSIEAGSVAWANVTGKPSAFATNLANISDLQANWDAILKAAPTSFVDAISDNEINAMFE